MGATYLVLGARDKAEARALVKQAAREDLAAIEAKLDGIQKLVDHEIERRAIAKAEYDRKVDAVVAGVAGIQKLIGSIGERKDELQKFVRGEFQGARSGLSVLADQMQQLADRINPNNAPRGPRRFQ